MSELLIEVLVIYLHYTYNGFKKNKNSFIALDDYIFILHFAIKARPLYLIQLT